MGRFSYHLPILGYHRVGPPRSDHVPTVRAETFERQFQNPKGELVQDRGKAILICKKQPDGSWKGVADIFNSDLPAPEPVTE